MSRYSLRETPRKSELFDGMVATPRRSSRRKSSFPLETSDLTDGDSSSAAETTTRMSRRRLAPKFTEHIDEDDSEVTPPSSATSVSPSVEDEKKIESATLPAKSNGRARKASKSAKENGHASAAGELIDGWRPGLDHRVDYSGEFEFGGSFGTLGIMIAFPLLMYYMWIGATYYDGKLPLPAEGQSLAEFGRHLLHLVYTGAFPSAKAWAIYWTFFVFEAVCYMTLPGVWAYGKPLAHEGGKQLKYFCNGFLSLYFTLFVFAALHVSGLFKLYTFLDEFGSIMSVAILSGTLCSLVFYFSAFLRGTTHRMTGYPIYDFFMGAELNPRLFGLLDFKMFFEVRLPWFILLLLSCGTAARQYERYGYVSGEVAFLVMAHYLYANACSKGEELIVPTWDMYYEKLGFMLTFWNMAGVPLSYCHCTLYLANHDPSTYRWNPYALAALFVSYLFVYWVWDSCNSQKNRFRAMEKGQVVWRKTFPQVPWQTIKNPKTITSARGDVILVDGWYGLARKVHYSCDAFFALSWGFITGFESPFPWFYPAFFCIMIAHRAWRDIHRCRIKYGDAWTEYEKRVPYLFIPYVI